MNNDRELLENAAKAAGIKLLQGYGEPQWRCMFYQDSEGSCHDWNPLTDDGDALRLAVKLGIAVEHFYSGPLEKPEWMFSRARRFQAEASCGRPGDTDPYAATRRAIVRAAAEIGKEQK